jgi:competence protein ComEC
MLWITLSLARKPRFWLVRKHTHLGLPPILLVLSFAIGIVRMQMTSLPISSSELSWYNNRGVVTIKGVICGYPDRRDTFQLLTVDASSLSTVNNADTMAIDGRLIIRTGIDASWVYGDEVLLTGRLTTPSNESDFSYRDYLARQSIHSTLYYPDIVLITRGHGNPLVSRIYSIRDKGLSILSRVFPMPESALLSGILLGVDNDIPASIQTAFRVTGTTHIIAISKCLLPVVRHPQRRPRNYTYIIRLRDPLRCKPFRCTGCDNGQSRPVCQPGRATPGWHQ